MKKKICIKLSNIFCHYSLQLLPGYLYSVVQLCLQGEKEVLLVVRPPHQVVQGYSKKISKKYIKSEVINTIN
jgi:hypothetical protein